VLAVSVGSRNTAEDGEASPCLLTMAMSFSASRRDMMLIAAIGRRQSRTPAYHMPSCRALLALLMRG